MIALPHLTTSPRSEENRLGDTAAGGKAASLAARRPIMTETCQERLLSERTPKSQNRYVGGGGGGNGGERESLRCLSVRLSAKAAAIAHRGAVRQSEKRDLRRGAAPISPICSVLHLSPYFCLSQEDDAERDARCVSA